jgi:Glycosyltransferase family 87
MPSVDWSTRDGLLTALTLAIAVGLIALVGVRWYAYQWDFHMFYGAARDFAAGINPYRGEGLSFYHPPLMLYVYRLFTFMPLPVALTVWYILKVAALGGLIWIWHAHFVRLQWHAATIAYFILAYQAAIYADLVAGNVSIFEELLLWFGFASLLGGRYLLFGLCLIVASQVKLTPVFFAVLLLVACDRPKWGAFFATVAGFAGLFSFNQWLQPALFQSFWMVSSRLDERGDDTSLLALTRDIFDRAFGKAFTNSSPIDELLFVAMVAAIVAVSWWRVVQYRRREPACDQRLLIGFACFVFALISPRFKVYTYILLLAPTLYVLRGTDWRRHVPLAAAVIVALVVFPKADNLLPIRFAFQLLNHYLPFFAAAAVWWACLDRLRKSSLSPPVPAR